jgi:hypothetical protein
MSHEQFNIDFRKTNDFYAAQEGLQRPGGMVIDRGGVPTCDVEAMEEWGWQLFHGVPLSAVLAQIRRSEEWRIKHANDPAPPIQPAGPLHREGLYLYGPDGLAVFPVGVTAFPILQCWLDGDRARVENFTDWMMVAGVKWARGLGSYSGSLGRFHPGEYAGRLFIGLHELLDFLDTKGLGLKLSALADCRERGDGTGGSLPDEGAQVEYVRRLGATMKEHGNAMLDGGNEHGETDGDSSKNGWLPSTLSRPDGVLCSRGSSCGDFSAPADPWDFADIHPGRTEFERKCKQLRDEFVGDNITRTPFRLPTGIDEGIGIGEADEYGRTTADPGKCFDFAVGCAVWGDFLILHVRAGMTLDVPGPIAQTCVAASLEGVRVVTREGWKEGIYTRGGPSAPAEPMPIAHVDAPDPVGALRTFAMVQGNRALAWAVTPGPEWTAQFQNGYHLESAFGWPGRPANVIYAFRG